ncbi:hypothetical protein D1007_47972 [Hordeum vulgare]|nr:hypothetical protein D1007_47972 [Hordeum vulgare]
MTNEPITYFRRTRKIPSGECVEEPAPDRERMLELRAGECVVFGTHFLVGFGLPENRFLWQLLEFYRLQMHHLGPNTVLYLPFFANLCEGYLGF